MTGPEDVFRAFDVNADRYDRWFDESAGRVAFESELACLREVSSGLERPWLEVGVGTGRFAEALGIEWGVDPAPRSLEFARRRGVQTLEAPGEALPFQDGRFGAVFLVTTLCFVDDPPRVLAEARRVLMPGGGIVVGVVPADSRLGRSIDERAAAGHVFYRHAKLHTLRQTTDMLSSTGLSIARTRSTTVDAAGGGTADAGAIGDFVALLVVPE